MTYTSAIFYFFASVLVFAGLRVITARNPVHAALYLVLAFFTAAGLWMLLEAEFLAITLVLVYVGAVMVLFLFVVMMLDIKIDALRQSFWRHFPLAATLGAVVVLEMAAVLMTGFRVSDEPRAALAIGQNLADISNTKELGKLLYTHYIYPVQVAAVILLVAMIAAIALTLRERKDTKTIDPSMQVHVRASERVQILKMDATRKAASGETAPGEKQS